MRPFTLLIKPAGPDCNLACRYCFYARKDSLFPQGPHRMSDQVLNRMVEDYMSLRLPQSGFAWQGGEPTLMGLDFFKRVVELQKQYGSPGQVVSNALQTNAVLLDDQWAQFLHQYCFLVGISLDGPAHLHDHYRVDHAGNPTHQRVMRAIDTCRAHKVEFNILALLNDRNVQSPDELFDYFVAQDSRFLQFIPCVEIDPQTGKITDYSVKPQDYGRFICRFFDRWLDHGPHKISVRLFDSLLSFYLHGRHTNCTFNDRCNDYVVVEHDGGVYCCDFFVDPQWHIGNIMDTPIASLFDSEIKRRFAKFKRNLANACLVCRHKQICRGGCLKDRLIPPGQTTAKSYLCSAYQMIFDHTREKLLSIAAQLRRPK